MKTAHLSTRHSDEELKVSSELEMTLLFPVSFFQLYFRKYVNTTWRSSDSFLSSIALSVALNSDNMLVPSAIKYSIASCPPCTLSHCQVLFQNDEI